MALAVLNICATVVLVFLCYLNLDPIDNYFKAWTFELVQDVLKTFRMIWPLGSLKPRCSSMENTKKNFGRL